MLVNANECDLASGNLQHKWLDATRRNFRYISRSFQLRSLGFSARLVISSPRGCRTSGVRLGSSDEMVLSWLLFSSLLRITHPLLSPEDFSCRPALVTDLDTAQSYHGWSPARNVSVTCLDPSWPGLARAPLNFAANKSSFDRVQNRPGNYSHFLNHKCCQYLEGWSGLRPYNFPASVVLISFWLWQELKMSCVCPSGTLFERTFRMALKEFLQRSKGSRGVLGQASKQTST